MKFGTDRYNDYAMEFFVGCTDHTEELQRGTVSPHITGKVCPRAKKQTTGLQIKIASYHCEV